MVDLESHVLGNPFTSYIWRSMDELKLLDGAEPGFLLELPPTTQLIIDLISHTHCRTK